MLFLGLGWVWRAPRITCLPRLFSATVLISEAEHLMNHRIEPLKPILTAHLFPKLDGMLIELLRSLGPEDWEKQTVSPKWKVKDVAAHLLDTALRGVSLVRDGYVVGSPRIKSAADLAAFINRLNGEGVTGSRRLSPPLFS